MTLLVHSKYMSGVLARYALRSMHDQVANEDGQVGEVPRDLYLNVHPLLGAERLQSHRILGRVLGSVLGTIHAQEHTVRHPGDLRLSLVDGPLTVAVSEALDTERVEPEFDYWAADEDVRVVAHGGYVLRGVIVKSFKIDMSFCPSWQSQNGIFENLDEQLYSETVCVPVDGDDLESLPQGFRFHIDALGEDEQLCAIDFEVARHPVRLMSVGRMVVERYTMDLAQSVAHAIAGDQAWLQERERAIRGLRIWAVDAWGNRSLVLLGSPDGGLLYVGQVDV